MTQESKFFEKEKKKIQTAFKTFEALSYHSLRGDWWRLLVQHVFEVSRFVVKSNGALKGKAFVMERVDTFSPSRYSPR